MTRITTLSVAFLLFATIISLVFLLTGRTAAEEESVFNASVGQAESLGVRGVWSR